MEKEFKKTFWMCLMPVLLIVSNLIGMKLTNFMNITIGVDFVTFPWTFLCTLLILNMGEKKEAYRSILIASIIQLLITISYTIAVNLGDQTLISDGSLYVNELFKVNQMNILGSVLAFILSHCLLIYIYESFKHFNKELYGIVMGLLGATFLNSIIYLPIILRDYETIFVINMLLSSVIVNIVMIVIIAIMFYIFKEKKANEKIIVINKKSLETKDLGIEELMNESVGEEKTKVVKKTNTTKKKTTNKSNSKKTSNIKKDAAKSKTKGKTSKTSQAKVKKDNK